MIKLRNKRGNCVTYHGNILPNYELTKTRKHRASHIFCASFWAGCGAGDACPGAAWASSGAAIGWGNWSSTGPSAMSKKIRVGIDWTIPSSSLLHPVFIVLLYIPSCTYLRAFNPRKYFIFRVLLSHIITSVMNRGWENDAAIFNKGERNLLYNHANCKQPMWMSYVL